MPSLAGMTPVLFVSKSAYQLLCHFLYFTHRWMNLQEILAVSYSTGRL